MLIDWVIYGAVTWGLATLLNIYFFREQPASKTMAWVLAVFVFFVNLLAMTALQYFRYQAISENLGFKVRPQNPLDAIGAFTFAWLFFALLRKQSSMNESQLTSSHAVADSPLTRSAIFPSREHVLPTTNEAAVKTVSTTRSEEDLWEIAADEVDGSSRRKGLWAKAFADAKGNEAEAKVNYLKWRVEQLQYEEHARQQQELTAETARQRSIEQRALSEAAQADSYRRSVRDLDTAPETVLLAFVEAVPPQHTAYVFSLRNDVGGTLLHTAAREGFASLAEALLAKGADPSLAGPKGHLPHQIAARNGHVQLAQRLERSFMAQDGK
jgi:hypothetical protein